MWLMTGAWLVGAAGAVVAVLAVRRRSRTAVPASVVAAEPAVRRSGRDDDGRSPCVGSGSAVGARARSAMGGSMGSASRDDCTGGTRSRRIGSRGEHMGVVISFLRGGVPACAAGSTGLPVPVDATAPIHVDATAGMQIDSTAAVPFDATAAVPVGLPRPSESGSIGAYGVVPTVLVAVLALVTAGAFLPAWDHYVGVVTTTGRSLGFSLGNAFTGPWPVVIGNVVVAVALVAVPVLASRLRDRKIAAATVAGSLIVLASQFTAAIVQVDRPVSPSVAGLTPAQSSQLGLQLHLSLTGWFTLDVLAAYALFAAVMVIGYLRLVEVQATSAGTWPSAPEARSPASLPWS